MKHIQLIIIGMLLVVFSGCFPVFVPVDDGHGHHDNGRHRGDKHRDHH